MMTPLTPATTNAELSRATEDYLKAVWHLQEAGEKASTTALSRRLNLAASTVSEAVKKLAAQGYLAHAPYASVTLTPAGQAVALGVVRRHRIVETYLHQLLDYDWDEVHDEAEILEHVVSDRLVEAMYRRLGEPLHDPHGDPIPQADGHIPAAPGFPLNQAHVGDLLVVQRISDDDPALLRYLAEHGLHPETQVRIKNFNVAAGLLVLERAGVEFSLGLGASERIEVALALPAEAAQETEEIHD